MTRRSSRGLTRRLALSLSALLIIGSLALPALAEEPPEQVITAPLTDARVPVGEPLILEASTGKQEDVVNWAVRTISPDRGSTTNVFGNVNGLDDTLDFDVATSTYSASFPTADLVPGDEYYFVFNWGDPADDGTRRFVQFSIIDPLADFNPDNEVVPCDQGESCSIERESASGQSFSVSTNNTQAKDGETARLGLRIPDPAAEDGPDGLRELVFDACQEILPDDQRLGSEVAHLVPVGFAGGDLTVTSFIPRSVINMDTNRGTSSFQICVAPTAGEAELYSDYSPTDLEGPEGERTGLVGPILLHDCLTSEQTACVEDRERVGRADLLITFRIPPADPWMR